MRLISLFTFAIIAFSEPLDEFVIDDIIFIGDPNQYSRNAYMSARKWKKGRLELY
jgi:hypothetical protein